MLNLSVAELKTKLAEIRAGERIVYGVVTTQGSMVVDSEVLRLVEKLDLQKRLMRFQSRVRKTHAFELVAIGTQSSSIDKISDAIVRFDRHRLRKSDGN